MKELSVRHLFVRLRAGKTALTLIPCAQSTCHECWGRLIPLLLSFPNAEHEAVGLQRETLRLGSAATDDVQITHDSVEAGHAGVVINDYGLVLNVFNGPVSVNGRHVRDTALLRPGDEVKLGDVVACIIGREPLRPRASVIGRSVENSDEDATQRTILRGLNGELLGRALPLAHLAVADELAVKVTQNGERIEASVESNARAEPALTINGHSCQRAELKPGDQLVIGDQRLMVEAADFVPGRDYLPHVESLNEDQQRAANHRERWIIGGLLASAILSLLAILALRG